MKKIISLCSVILAVSIIVTAFAACGKDKDKGNETTTAVPAQDGLILEVMETGAKLIKDGKLLQELSYPEMDDRTFDFAYAQAHAELIDMNFDGIEDVCIPTGEKDGVIKYYCWLYVESSNSYELSIMLCGITNISIDPVKQEVLSTVKIDGVERINIYKWVNGTLTFSNGYGDGTDIPEDVSISASENSVGNKKPSKNEAEGTTKKPSKKPSKKPNETTTKPSKKPAATTTTSVAKPNINVGEGNFDEGWF